jgi:hypothetical protein
MDERRNEFKESRHSRGRGVRSVMKKDIVAFRNLISAILYACDPRGMGSSVGAPLDEYDSEANLLVSRLQREKSRESIEHIARSEYPSAPEALVNLLTTATMLFNARYLLHNDGRDARVGDGQA